MTSLHILYARRDASTHGGSLLSTLSVASSPGGQLQHSAKSSWSPISLSLPLPWRNNPALRQKVQGKQDSVLGAIRRHCCQTRLGAAHELTTANAIYKSSFKSAAVCGKSIIHSYCFIFPMGFFSHSFLHMTGLCCWHNCAKKPNSLNGVKIKSRLIYPVATLKTPWDDEATTIFDAQRLLQHFLCLILCWSQKQHAPRSK